MKEFTKAIELRCRNADKYSQIICKALVSCGCSAGTDSSDADTAFVLLNGRSIGEDNRDVSADIIVFDDSSCEADEISRFRIAVTDYENARHLEGKLSNAFTFSEEHYGAELACRSVSRQDDGLAFDIVSGGILSRVRVKRDDLSVRDVLLCTAVLIAAGIPIASVVSCFGS